MLKLYYRIWVDCIQKIRNFDSDFWEYKSMLVMTFAMSVQFMIIMAILQRNIIGYTFYDFSIEKYFSGKGEYLIKWLVLYCLPVIVINYFLIFNNKKYNSG